jgi:hypothetical protein
MAAVDMTADMPMSPQDMWDHVADLSDLGDWLVLHEGWRSELPDEITEGTEIVGVARSKGLRNRVTWTVLRGSRRTRSPCRDPEKAGRSTQ